MAHRLKPPEVLTVPGTEGDDTLHGHRGVAILRDTSLESLGTGFRLN